MSVDWKVAEINHWRIGKADMARRAGKEFLDEVRVDLPQLDAKNYEVQVRRHEQYQQCQHQQSQQQGARNPLWSGGEEAFLLAKHRAGMKWTDISNRLPGRTRFACASHHHFLLEKCGGWSPELQNKLCKVYER